MGLRKKIINYINKIKSIGNNSKHSSISSSISAGSNLFNNSNMITDLSKFISYKSISCKIEYQSECWNAETRLMQGNVGKNPIVLAKFTNKINIKNKNKNNNNKRIRIVMYGHYDVVDINNKSGWCTPPFKLTGKNGYLYRRGTTDNK